METTDTTEHNIEKIAVIFQNVITEIEDEDGVLRKGIDFYLLRQELSGDYIEGREERYDFTWVGKKKAIFEANRPIKKHSDPAWTSALKGLLHLIKDGAVKHIYFVAEEPILRDFREIFEFTRIRECIRFV